MNIVMRSLLVGIGLLISVQVQPFTFKFNNNTVQNLVAKIKVRKIPEETLVLPANDKAEKTFAITGFDGCTEYIKLRKQNGDVVDPKLVIVDEDKLATFMYKKDMQEPIDLDELVDPEKYTGVVIIRSTGICDNTTLDVFMDMHGDLLLVMLRNSIVK
jgi:hypothetical protein